MNLVSPAGGIMNVVNSMFSFQLINFVEEMF